MENSLTGETPAQKSDVGSSEVREFKVQPAIPPDLLRLIQKLQQNYAFFSEMSEIEIGGFLKMCKQEAYEEKQTIFSEGDNADHFYLLVSGEVSISIKENEVARLEPGEIIGEMALLEDIPRTATVSAVKKSVLFFIPVKALSTKLPSMAYKVLLGVAQQMSARLREANEHLKIPKKEAAK
jgi:CRP-like cAMP-binding protein